MRFICTTEPPRGLVTDYGLRIEYAPPIFADGATETGQQAGNRAARDIMAAVGYGHTSVVLRDVLNLAGDIDDDTREWWDGFGSALVGSIGPDIIDIDAIAIDHARYPGGSDPDEEDWQHQILVGRLVELADRHRAGTRIGMYGHHQFSPTVWTSARYYTTLPGYHRRALAWTIMPGQYRRQAPPPTCAEFIGVLDMLCEAGIDTCCVWSDPRLDATGREKTKPQDWEDFLVAAAVLAGRRLDVPRWSPPSWLPPMDAIEARGTVRGGVFGAEAKP